MQSASADQFITDLLTRQTEMIRKAIVDLEEVLQDLPPTRQSEVNAIIARLQAAIREEQEGLALLARAERD